MSDTIFWGTHRGGYGATFCPVLHILYYSIVNNKKIIHNCKNPYCDIYKNTIIHNFLLKNSNNNDDTSLFYTYNDKNSKDLTCYFFGDQMVFNKNKFYFI